MSTDGLIPFPGRRERPLAPAPASPSGVVPPAPPAGDSLSQPLSPMGEMIALLRQHSAQLERIVAALTAPEPLPRILVSKAEAMALLDCQSDGAFYARCHELGLRSIGGSYRLRDLDAAAERRSLALRRRPSLRRKSA